MSGATRKTDSPLRARIAALRKLHGRPERPAVTDPFQQILWENVAYLAHVLQRLGYGREGKSYAASYRATREAVAPELPRDFNGLIGAYLLLRRHGQELCRRTHPRCEVCPLRAGCAYARSGA